MHWNYDRAELIADGVVHIVGVCLGLVAATALIVLTAVYASALEIAVVSIYVAGLLAMLTLSAMYNLWPVSRAKWVLRRFDHSAIYLLIAATYTPFIVQLKESYLAIALLAGVWCVAIAGVALKLARPGRYDRLAVGLYLALGWSGVMLGDAGGQGGAAAGAGPGGGGRRALQPRRDLPCLAAAALSERDLARLRLARRGVPLYGYSRYDDLDVTS
jgi:hemolysin III